ncbi:MAG: Spy/CpxP family protein refolding chaperone [Phycisphaerae bacterium]
MTRFLCFALLSMLVLPSVAQNRTPAPTDQPPQVRDRQRDGARGGRDWMGGMARRLTTELSLDEQQQAQLSQMMASWAEQAPMAQMRELGGQIREAREAGDDARAQELIQQMQALRAAGAQHREQFMDQLETILREDQVAKLSEVRERMQQDFRGGPGGFGGGMRGGPQMFIERAKEQLNLDDAQAAHLDELVAAARNRAGGPGADGPGALWRQMREAREAGDEDRVNELRQQMRADGEARAAAFEQVLTELEKTLRPEQKAALADFRAEMAERRAGIGGPGGPPQTTTDPRSILRAARGIDGLSYEQKEQIEELTREAQSQMREVRRDREAAAELGAKLKQQITTLLTPAQREDFERALSRARGGDRDRMRDGERRRDRDGQPGTPAPADKP